METNKIEYRPFKTIEECLDEMSKHNPVGYLKHKKWGDIVVITWITMFAFKPAINISSSKTIYNMAQVFFEFDFIDGTPFGAIKGNENE